METRCENSVFWIGVSCTPGISEVDCIIDKILESSGKIVVHAQHTRPDIFIPHWNVIMHILKKLNCYSKEIETRLIGTIIQTPSLDHMTKSIIQVILLLYKPKKPLCITDNDDDVRLFLENLKIHSL